MCFHPHFRGIAVLAALLLLAATGGARAAELVMFESQTCDWCRRFHAEITPIYPKTAEAACAPLRRVDVNAPRPRDLGGIKSILFTPTFVVVDSGREVGRLTGYPGDDFFWPKIGAELRKLGDACRLP